MISYGNIWWQNHVVHNDMSYITTSRGMAPSDSERRASPLDQKIWTHGIVASNEKNKRIYPRLSLNNSFTPFNKKSYIIKICYCRYLWAQMTMVLIKQVFSINGMCRHLVSSAHTLFPNYFGPSLDYEPSVINAYLLYLPLTIHMS